MKKSKTNGRAATAPTRIDLPQASAGHKSTIQSRPGLVGSNSSGTGRGSKSTDIKFATTAKVMMAIGTAKLETVSRTHALKYGDLLKFARYQAKDRVTTVRMSSCVASKCTFTSGLSCASVFVVNLSMMLVRPSVMKIADTKKPKRSCVKREQYLIRAHRSVTDMMIMNIPTKIPVHACTVRKGTSMLSQILYSCERKTVIGPVGRRMMSGCPENSAKNTPLKPCVTKYSTTPVSDLVCSSKNDPNAMAGAKQPKNMYNVAVKVLMPPATPSVQSEVYHGSLRAISFLIPPANFPERIKPSLAMGSTGPVICLGPIGGAELSFGIAGIGDAGASSRSVFILP
mmetsp:Transcript_59737/g.142134  ORF Transcript_59737/g.142134 Transcript_59737/m.142134 type:complete len:342 (+) Transcript_59737:908-1933(+)